MTGAATTMRAAFNCRSADNCGEHGRSGRDAVIDKNDGLTFDSEWWQIVAISFFATLESRSVPPR